MGQFKILFFVSESKADQIKIRFKASHEYEDKQRMDEMKPTWVEMKWKNLKFMIFFFFHPGRKESLWRQPWKGWVAQNLTPNPRGFSREWIFFLRDLIWALVCYNPPLGFWFLLTIYPPSPRFTRPPVRSCVCVSFVDTEYETAIEKLIFANILLSSMW